MLSVPPPPICTYVITQSQLTSLTLHPPSSVHPIPPSPLPPFQINTHNFLPESYSNNFLLSALLVEATDAGRLESPPAFMIESTLHSLSPAKVMTSPLPSPITFTLDGRGGGEGMGGGGGGEEKKIASIT